MKKSRKTSGIAVLLLLIFLIAFVPAPRAIAAGFSGECGKDGDNLTWSYSDGVLTINGAGEMADYEKGAPGFPWNDMSNVPWNNLSGMIERVELPEGLTSIGNRAFSGCDNLTSIELPDSLTSIGENVFDGCVYLTITVGHDSYAEQYFKDIGRRYQYRDNPA